MCTFFYLFNFLLKILLKFQTLYIIFLKFIILLLIFIKNTIIYYIIYIITKQPMKINIFFKIFLITYITINNNFFTIKIHMLCIFSFHLTITILTCELIFFTIFYMILYIYYLFTRTKSTYILISLAN